MVATETVRMAAASGHTFGVDDIAVGAATELGYFAEASITPDWVGKPGGVAAIEALASGEVDVAYAGFGPTMRARTAGTPIKLFVSMALGLGQALVVQSRITDPAQLRGVSWAVDGIDAMSHHFAQLILRAYGVADDQVHFVVKGPPPSAVAALLSQEVDCSLIRLEEAINVTRDHPQLHTLLDFDQLLQLVPLQPHGVMVTHEDYAQKQPDAIVKVAQGIMLRHGRSITIVRRSCGR